MSENEPRRKSWLVLVTHLLGCPFMGPPSGYSLPSALSCTGQAHIPQLRGGAPRGFSSMVWSEVGGKVVMVVVVLKREMNQTSTIDAVDV